MIASVTSVAQVVVPICFGVVMIAFMCYAAYRIGQDK